MNGPDFGFTPSDVVVVTGAGSGIGRATALLAARMGLTVSAWDLDGASAQATAAQASAEGGRCVPYAGDVGEPAAVRAGMADAARLGTVRHLVNNAGPASSTTLDFDDAIRLAVGSVRLVTEAWLELADPPAGASVVNVASVAGNLVGTSPDWYPTAKAAIMGYTRHLATYRADRLRANAVAPGMTDTPRLAGFAASEVGQRILTRIPVHRMGRPEELAAPILFLLSPMAAYINGVLLPVDGGWTIAQ